MPTRVGLAEQFAVHINVHHAVHYGMRVCDEVFIMVSITACVRATRKFLPFQPQSMRMYHTIPYHVLVCTCADMPCAIYRGCSHGYQDAYCAVPTCCRAVRSHAHAHGNTTTPGLSLLSAAGAYVSVVAALGIVPSTPTRSLWWYTFGAHYLSGVGTDLWLPC